MIKTKKQSCHLRKYKEGDEQQIIKLYNYIFNTSRNLKHWNHKYKQNPVGFKIYVAEDEKRIVGHYGLVLAKIKVGNRIVMGSQAVDAVTHPDYQRQGIFVKLGKEILRDAGKEDIPITYGFPNEPALPGHRKVGWIEIGNASILIKPLNIKNILREYTNNNSLLRFGSYIISVFLKLFARNGRTQVEDLTVKRVFSFDEQTDEFWCNVANDYSIIQVRNREFLNWRYVKIPDRQYTIFGAKKNGKFLGYIVLGEIIEEFRKGGIIVDILTYSDRGEISGCLLSKAMEHFEGKNMDYVACLMRKGNIYYKVLKKFSFIATPIRTRFIVHINSDSISKSLACMHKWFFTWGDSDYM